MYDGRVRLSQRGWRCDGSDIPVPPHRHDRSGSGVQVLRCRYGLTRPTRARCLSRRIDGTDFVEVGGGGGSASVYAFSATLADIANIASGTAFANLTSGLTAGELINQSSGFTVETAARQRQVSYY